jgi:hypothetical protein
MTVTTNALSRCAIPHQLTIGKSSSADKAPHKYLAYLSGSHGQDLADRIGAPLACPPYLSICRLGHHHHRRPSPLSTPGSGEVIRHQALLAASPLTTPPIASEVILRYERNKGDSAKLPQIRCHLPSYIRPQYTEKPPSPTATTTG